MNRHNGFYLPLRLDFFAGDKTEQPTQRKRTKAREEGSVARSTEVGTAFMILAMFFGLKIASGYMLGRMQGMFTANFTMLADVGQYFDPIFISKYVASLFTEVIIIALPLFAVALAVGLGINFAQVGWKLTVKPLMPKFNRLSPGKGFKRLFSMQVLVNLVKSIFKLAIIGAVLYMSVSKEVYNMPSLLNMDIMDSVLYLGNLIITMGLNVGMFFMFVAGLDYAYTRYKHTKELKMTKQEVKEEYKQVEGNPLIKSKIRRRMMDISMRRMMHEVPTADVIITNPTHYACALKYNKDGGGAPVMVAKGVDYVARRIREVAKENRVEIVENVQLARTLYAQVDIGREIPPDLYQAVAEVLAYVYRLKNTA